MLFLALVAAYLLGSFPSGYILAKVFKGIDIRQHGSGNPGATNVFRVVSPVAGVVVLVLDILKGVVSATVLTDLILSLNPHLDPTLTRLVLSLSCVCGHNWSLFLGFKGGKGIATTAGALIGLGLKIPFLGMIFGLCFGVWLLVILVSRFVSLASISAALALPVFMLIFQQPFKLLVFSSVLCLFALYRHKSNIRRLLSGEEQQIFRSGKH